jgi:hypothetical protein
MPGGRTGTSTQAVPHRVRRSFLFEKGVNVSETVSLKTEKCVFLAKAKI